MNPFSSFSKKMCQPAGRTHPRAPLNFIFDFEYLSTCAMLVNWVFTITSANATPEEKEAKVSQDHFQSY